MINNKNINTGTIHGNNNTIGDTYNVTNNHVSLNELDSIEQEIQDIEKIISLSNNEDELSNYSKRLIALKEKRETIRAQIRELVKYINQTNIKEERLDLAKDLYLSFEFEKVIKLLNESTLQEEQYQLLNQINQDLDKLKINSLEFIYLALAIYVIDPQKNPTKSELIFQSALQSCEDADNMLTFTLFLHSCSKRDEAIKYTYKTIDWILLKPDYKTGIHELEQLFCAYQILAELYKLNDITKTVSYYKNAIEVANILKQLKQSDTTFDFLGTKLLASAHLCKANYKLAEETYLNALKILEKSDINKYQKTAHYSDICGDLGLINYRRVIFYKVRKGAPKLNLQKKKKYLKTALFYYALTEEALCVLSKKKEWEIKTMSQLCALYLNVALVHWALNQLKESDAMFEKSLELYKQLCPYDPVYFNWQIGILYYTLADVYRRSFDRNRKLAAKDFFIKSLKYCRKNTEIKSAYHNQIIGKIALDFGCWYVDHNWKKSLSCYKYAVKQYLKVEEVNNAESGLLPHCYSLISILYSKQKMENKKLYYQWLAEKHYFSYLKKNGML